ncbi:sensor histidine kinase [Oceanidesulfovibrio marinus]|uniref:histidine kinase n=1 Tax=Oceanidesulfovibrio marinus TaxID=370038 RepID=A0ABX6NL27_9BACT|nr:HAMP domain-containing sensor histidine kinase [Oceanidesulfovibrio marinus]QJT10325.1 HAMP domain-containing protein [Oceanidesulfovibrio marinus]
MPKMTAWRLTIRQRFLAILLFFIISMGIVGTLSFFDLVRIRELTLLVSEVQQLSNALLETRRFEKNFLLYGNPADLAEARNYLEHARVLVNDVARKRGKTGVLSTMDSLRENLADYGQSMETLGQELQGGRPASEAELNNIRAHGKEMVSLAENLLTSESKRIISIIDTLKMQLLTSVVVVIALGVTVALMMFGRLFNTLNIIQTATRRIAQGVFEPLPEVGGESEAKTIVRALNAMVRELEFRQAQLLQAQKLSSIGTLAAGIAHQLNNPLNNISTSSQILIEELDSADPNFMRKMLNNVESESLRAKEIVQGLLEFSRERNFSIVRENLATVIKKTVRLVSSQVPGNIEIIVDVPEDLEVYLDAQRFQEALLNLIINAVHAMDPNPGTVTIVAQKDENTVTMSVADTGKGIPEEVRNQIFDPFFTTKGETGGTGLGLSIVYGIVEKHGGKITVDSEPGAGTTFTIRIPTDMMEQQAREQ